MINQTPEQQWRAANASLERARADLRRPTWKRWVPALLLVVALLVGGVWSVRADAYTWTAPQTYVNGTSYWGAPNSNGYPSIDITAVRGYGVACIQGFSFGAGYFRPSIYLVDYKWACTGPYGIAHLAVAVVYSNGTSGVYEGWVLPDGRFVYRYLGPQLSEPWHVVTEFHW